MDAVTLIGIVAVAVMFLAGVTLVGMGLRRHPQRLPQGADAIFDAVARGELAAPPTRSLDLAARPAPAARSAATATAKPLPEILAERVAPQEPDLVRPPASPPRAEASTPAVRLVPRPAATGTTALAERTAAPVQNVVEKPAPVTVEAAPTVDTPTPVVPRTLAPTPAPTPSRAKSEILAAAKVTDSPLPEPEPAPAVDSTAMFVADLNRALLDDDDAESDEARSFLDAEPKLQRF